MKPNKSLLGIFLDILPGLCLTEINECEPSRHENFRKIERKYPNSYFYHEGYRFWGQKNTMKGQG